MNLIKHICIIVFLLCNSVVRGQHTTQGRDFWVSFGNNNNSNIEELTFQVRIVATNSPATVIMTFTNTEYSDTIFLAAGSVYTRDLSLDEKQAIYSSTSGISTKSLHIRSDADILVYAINLLAFSTDATAVLPVASLGASYYHLSYAPVSGQMDGYTLIALENSTDVYENGIYKCQLNEGEVYSQYFTDDVTGTNVTANKSIAYFVTNSRVNVPVGVNARDCLYEQLFPETSWGSSFIIPVTVRGVERVRILASQNGTTVVHAGGSVVSGSLSLDAGEFVELEIYRNEGGCYIEANSPVAVVSYLTGISYERLSYSVGDPAMTWIPSIEQSVNEITLAPFMASGSSILSEHHILVVTPTADKSMTEVRVGNASYTPVSGGVWTDHSASGFSFYSMPLTEAALSYSFRNPGGITVLGYGLGNRESYYYLSGSATRKLSAAFYINNIHYQDLDGQEFCSDRFDIKAVIRYEMDATAAHLKWIVDGRDEVVAQDLIQWSKIFTEDTHTISMIVKDEYGETDTLTVSFAVNIRKIELRDTTVCKNQSVELDVKNPSAELTYRWYSNPDFSGFIVQKTSLAVSPVMSDTVFYVEALSNIGCSVRDSVKIKANLLPELTAGDVDICKGSTTTVNASSADAVSLTWYSDPMFTDFITRNHSFETAEITSDTAFYVEALSVDGCSTRDTVKVITYNVSVNDISVCYGSTAAISVSHRDISSLTWYKNPDYSDAFFHAASFETSGLTNDTAFYLETLSTKGCVARNYVKITVDPLPVMITSDANVCAGILSLFAPENNAVSLIWYSDAAYSNPAAQSISYNATFYNDTVLYVEALSDKGCSTKDSIEITVTRPPAVVAMDDRHFCYGDDEISLTVLHSEGLVTWNVENTNVKPESTQQYIVTASRPPCPDARDTVQITTGEQLYIDPSELQPYQPYANYSVQLNANAQSPDYTLIEGELPPGMSLSPSGNLSGTPDGDVLSTTFTVQIEDENHCIATQKYVLERDFFIPKMFTPNGDGVNDIFMQGYEIVIFDRLGREIFRGNDGWNGFYKNKPAKQDIYFYSLTRKLENNKTKVYNGYVGTF
jgi:gliding motility-associated-like protein